MLKYVNSCPFPVSLCIMWYSPNCPDGGDWTKKGWWNLAPNGGSAKVHSADLADVNRFWCDFIQGGGVTWDGSGVIRPVPSRRFEWCEWTGSTDAFDADFFVNDIGDSDDIIFELTPSLRAARAAERQVGAATHR